MQVGAAPIRLNRFLIFSKEEKYAEIWLEEILGRPLSQVRDIFETVVNLNIGKCTMLGGRKITSGLE